MRKSNYWQGRIQKENERNYRRTVKETEELLAKAYGEQAEKLQAEMLKILSKIEHDARTPEGMHINDFYRNRRTWSLLETVNRNLRQLGHKQLKITSKSLTDLYKTTQEILEQEGDIDGISFLETSVLDAAQAINTVWAMDGKDLSTRIWTDKEKLQQYLMRHMTDFVIQGKSPWEISCSLAKEMEANVKNADRLVRTETAHIQNKAMIDRYTQLGYTQGEFLTATGCCGHCQKMNGQRFPLKELEHLLPAHPNCRCTFTLVDKKMEG